MRWLGAGGGVAPRKLQDRALLPGEWIRCLEGWRFQFQPWPLWWAKALEIASVANGRWFSHAYITKPPYKTLPESALKASGVGKQVEKLEGWGALKGHGVSSPLLYTPCSRPLFHWLFLSCMLWFKKTKQNKTGDLVSKLSWVL